MPSFRGVEVSIVAEPDKARLPELIQPETAVVCSPSCEVRTGCPVSPSLAPTIKYQALPGVTVYTLFIPGARFWVRYAIDNSPPPSRYVYFKVFSNGRSVVSFGVDAAVQPDGSIGRAFYDPDNIKEGSMSMRQEGIEARFFQFAVRSEVDIDEEGLLEVQVFRASKRKRVAPVLTKAPVNRKGNTFSTSSLGLLSKPQDAIHFHWLLLDPKDFPLATFRFHLLTWVRYNYAVSLTSLSSMDQNKDNGGSGPFGPSGEICSVEEDGDGEHKDAAPDDDAEVYLSACARTPQLSGTPRPLPQPPKSP